MAPEQRNSPGKGDRRSDIYSFGLILFEMVTGKWAPPQAIPDKLLETSLPDQLQHLIKTCVRDDPAQRYADVGELEYTLNALTNKLGVRLPISPDASVSLEVALMDWCGKILPNVASIPPREIAYSVSQNVGPVIDHSVLGADGSEKRRKLREDGPAAHQTELTRQGRVAQWVRRFGEDASSDVVWEQMYEQQERLQDELSGPGPLSSDGVSFWRWYQKAMGLLALGCVEESLKCFDHVISGVADDGLVWDPKGRTEYGLACLGKGLALIELDRRAEAAKVLDLALDARFYPMGVRNSYLTLTPGKIRIDKTDVTDLGKYGREIAAVRQARSLC
jgi:tetratricopeptide (TPR) repeat protein